ncbi:MAG: cob(I)yrinic acid a,c-diamide adenosyltransferase [Dehalococcoidia bacterium]|jgi:cob(I)alamin adenosyltransferase
MAEESAGNSSIVIVFTGDGKGKTTAALGILLRAWGRGLRVVMLSFIKAAGSNFGEHRAARRMGVEIIPMGAGFTWLSQDLENDKALAVECWKLCQEKLASGSYDVVILDEITYPLAYGWLPLEEVLDTLRSRPPNVHVVITGRDAPEALIDFADLVTEMQEVKHPYHENVKAIVGIDL